MKRRTASRREVLVGIGAATGIAACGSGTGDGGAKLGVAVVGIGNLSLGQIIPALQNTERCRLMGLVSSSTEKLRDVGTRYDVPASRQFTYDNFERIADDPDIEAVYIALPNALHAEYAIRAAQAGKHVFCEKPLGVSVEQCNAMIAASNAADKYLGVAYRLLFDPHHLEMIRLTREQTYGPVQIIHAEIGFPVDDDWRLNRELAGGGALIEQGIYAVNAARNMFAEDPIQVMAHESKTDRSRFSEVEESVFWTMAFPGGGIAHCAASYTVRMNRLWAGAVNGEFGLAPAYDYDGIRGDSTGGAISYSDQDQFATQLDEFARSIQQNLPLGKISAEEGLKDVTVIRAIYESIRQGESVRLSASLG